jgi:beta-ureidopropionase
MTLTVALTQTVNAYSDMPATVDDLPHLASRLDDVRQANLDHHETLIASAASQGAKLVQLGELFAYPYFALTELGMWNELAEDTRTGPSVTFMKRVAAEHSVVIVAPIFERDAATGRRFNSAVVIDADGAALGAYRKTHIPHGSNERASYRERFYYQASDGEMHVEADHNTSPHRFFPVFRTAVARVGVAICYDRHFDGVVRSLAGGGAQLVCCPAVTFGNKSRRMWRLESATDATRHRTYVACSNKLGMEPPYDVAYFGDSHVMGPDGECPNRSDDPELVIAELDLDTSAGADPAGWNIAGDIRHDIYG